MDRKAKNCALTVDRLADWLTACNRKKPEAALGRHRQFAEFGCSRSVTNLSRSSLEVLERPHSRSRGEAKCRFTLTDHRAAGVGVECRKDQSVMDETLAAHKDIDAVMQAQRDLVDVVRTLKQVVCVKS